MSTDSIVFFYPSKIVGGAELLFARLGKYIKEKLDIDVFYVDYKDGYIRNNQDFSMLSFIDFVDGEKTIIENIDALITPISNVCRITDYISVKNKEMKMLFWTIHPLNLLHVMPKGSYIQHKPMFLKKFLLKHFYKNKYNFFKKILVEFDELNACLYMDFENRNFQCELFDTDLSKNYLPVPCLSPTVSTTKDFINEYEINVCVLGRLSKEKVYPLISIIDNLANYKTDKKKIIHIIGDGEYKELINVNRCKNNVELRFIGTIERIESLRDYLTNNADIVFAMGTSVLEAAALKIPAILIPYHYKTADLSKYIYIYEAFDYLLGTNIDEYKKIATNDFSKILDDIYINNKKTSQGEKCYDYYNKNHSMPSIVKKLFEKLDKNCLDYKKYKQVREMHEKR